VLNVRIDWHVKRPTNKKVKRRAVQSQAGRRETSKATRADRVHASAVVGERANSGQRGQGSEPKTRRLLIIAVINTLQLKIYILYSLIVREKT